MPAKRPEPAWRVFTHPSGMHEENHAEAWKGLVAGAVAGAGAAWVMTQFQTRVAPRVQDALAADGEETAAKEEESEGGSGEPPATVKAANRISSAVRGRELHGETAKKAGNAMHYAMGTVTGAIYGTLAERAPVVTRGMGLPYGTAVWAGADEMIVPALGLGQKPTESPPSTHAYALASHLVYGASLELLRRGVRAAL